MSHRPFLTLPQAGTENNDHNPDRVKPRNLFDIAFGTDNLFHAERHKMAPRFTVTNLTDKVALYNFLSTFSGTRFVPACAFDASVGYVFRLARSRPRLHGALGDRSSNPQMH